MRASARHAFLGASLACALAAVLGAPAAAQQARCIPGVSATVEPPCAPQG